MIEWLEVERKEGIREKRDGERAKERGRGERRKEGDFFCTFFSG